MRACQRGEVGRAMRSGKLAFLVRHSAYHTMDRWTTLIAWMLIVALGVCVLLGQAWARWTGVVLVVLDAIASFLFLVAGGHRPRRVHRLGTGDRAPAPGRLT